MKWIDVIKAVAYIMYLVITLFTNVFSVLKKLVRLFFSLLKMPFKIIKSLFETIHIKYKILIEKIKLDKKKEHKKTKKRRKKYLSDGNIFKKIVLGALWGIKSVLLEVFWFCWSIIHKVFWFCWFIVHKTFWFLWFVFHKSFWFVWGVLNKIYWFAHGIYQKFHWWRYRRKAEFYYKLSQIDYIDLILIFINYYRNKNAKRVDFIPLTSVEKFVIEHNNCKISFLEDSKEREVCIPEYFEKSKKKIERYISEKIYIAEIENVELIGASDVVISEQCMLNDAVYNDKEKRLDIRYGAIKKTIGDLVIIENYDMAREIDHAIYLIGAASFNYYHLVVEILSRLALADSFEEYIKYPLLVDEIVRDVPQFHTALSYINNLHHEVIYVKKDEKVKVKRLIMPSHIVWMPINLFDRKDIKASDFLISKVVIENIRKNVPLYTEKKPWRKIFISRKNTKAMRLKNEETIRNIFSQNGFEIIFTEEMTFEQQVKCFGQAKYIVASSGAALTNILFCQPDTVIGCIIPSYHQFYMYSTIANYLQLKPIFLDAEIVEMTPYAASDIFTLDEKYALRYIKQICN